MRKILNTIVIVTISVGFASACTTEMTPPRAVITDFTLTENSIDFDMAISDKSGRIASPNEIKVQIYDDEILVKEIFAEKFIQNDVLITDLKNNYHYTLKITIDYRDDTGAINNYVLFQEEFTTKKNEPTAKIIVNKLNNTLIVKASIIDVDNTIGTNKKELVLYRDDIVESRKEFGEEVIFSNIDPYKDYVVKLETTYNDNETIHKNVAIGSEISMAEKIPEINGEIIINGIASNSISFNASYINNNNIVTAYKINLYKSDELETIIQSTTNLKDTFTNLDSNTEYLLNLIVDYDTGYTQETKILADVSQLTYNKPPSAIMNFNKIHNKIVVNADITDTDQAIANNSTMFVLYKDEVELQRLNYGANVTFENLTSGANYVVKLQTIYHNNFENIAIELDTITFKTSILETPTSSISILSKSVADIEYNILITDNSNAITSYRVMLVDNISKVERENSILKGKFEVLDSNTEYTLKLLVNYSTDTESIVDEEIARYTVFTNKTKPSISYLNLTTAEDKIIVNYALLDSDNATILLEAILLDNNSESILDINNNPVKINLAAIGTIGEFSDLNSNTNYIVKILANYNDGVTNYIGEELATNNINTFKKAPTATIIVNKLNNTLIVNADIIDVDNTIGTNKKELVLYRADIEESRKEFGEGVIFSNTDPYKDYVVRLETTYNDNETIHENVAIGSEISVAEKIPEINGEIIISGIDSNSISFNGSYIDDGQIVIAHKIELYKSGELETIIQSTTNLNDTFINLDSNTEYLIKLVIDYDDDYTQETKILDNVSQLTYNKPPSAIMNFNKTHNKIIVNADITDTDKTIANNSTIFVLYKDELELQRLNYGENVTFENLTSETDYVVKLQTIYHNNFENIAIELDTISFKTSILEAPTSSISILSQSDINIAYDILITDTSNVITSYRVILVDNISKVERENSILNGKFENLDSNTEYTLKLLVNYSTDTESIVDEEIAQYTLLTNKTKPSINFLNLTATENKIIVNYSLLDSDNSTILLEAILLDNNSIPILDINNNPVKINLASTGTLDEFSDLNSNTNYVVKILANYHDSVTNYIGEELAINNINTFKKAPTATISDITSTTTSIAFVVDVMDEDVAITDFTNTIVNLYNGWTLVKTEQIISTDSQTIVFTDLSSGVDYKIEVASTYMIDGVKEDTNPELIAQSVSTLKDEPTATINNVSSIANTITFTANVIDADGAITDFTKTTANLYNGATLVMTEQIIDITPQTIIFSGLNSNISYDIKIASIYSVDGTNNITNPELIAKSVNTLKDEPTATITSVLPTNSTITFTADVTDDDGAITDFTKTTANLYNGTTLVMTERIISTVPQVITFTELDNNTAYDIKIASIYNVDGTNDITNTELITQTINTLKDEPTATINNVSSTANTITFTADVTDADSAITDFTKTTANLYNGTKLVMAEQIIDTTSQTMTFTGLDSNIIYDIKIASIYSVDEINDTVNPELIAQSINTLKANPSALISSISSTNSTIIFTAKVTDNDLAITDFTNTTANLYAGTTLIMTEQITSPTSQIITFTGLDNNKAYDLKIASIYSVDELNDITNPELIAQSVNTLKDEPTATISNVSSTTNTITFTVDVTDNDIAITDFANTTAYLCDGTTLIMTRQIISTDPQIITFPGLDSNITYDIKIASIYSLDGLNNIANSKLITQSVSTLKNEPTATLSSVSSTSSTITFTADVTDNDGAITDFTKTTAKLYNGTTLVATEQIINTAPQTITFTGLDSNTTYDIKTASTYNIDGINDIVNPELITLSINTPKIEPSATISNISLSNSSITFTVDVTDADSAITDFTNTTANLYEGTTLVRSEQIISTVSQIMTFTGLDSNRSYDIKIASIYNVDGTNDITNSELITQSVSTLKDEPTAAISSVSSTSSTINFTVDVTDNDGAITDFTNTTAKLYNGTTLVRAEQITSTTSQVITFIELDSTISYDIKISSTYNVDGLNDITNTALTTQSVST